VSAQFWCLQARNVIAAPQHTHDATSRESARSGSAGAAPVSPGHFDTVAPIVTFPEACAIARLVLTHSLDGDLDCGGKTWQVPRVSSCVGEAIVAYIPGIRGVCRGGS